MATKKTTKKAVKAAKPAAAKKAPAKKAASVAKKAELDCTDDLALEVPAEPVKKAARKPAAKKEAAPKAEAPKAPEAPKAEAPKAEAPKAPAKKEPAAPKKARVTFSVRAEVGSKVFVAGDFNGWDPTAKQLQDKNGTGLFTGCINLDKGRYEYKFVINGDWYADPECADWTQNDMGTLNSVKVVD